MERARVTLPDIFPVTCHTDHVGPGTTFVAIQGMHEDGARYIPQALERGATTIVIHDEYSLSDTMQEHVNRAKARLICVEDTRKALADMSAQAHGYPAKQLKIIGITGTKGKTTTAYLLEHVVRSAGYTTALLSTVANKIGSTWFDTELTTQQPDYLHTFFKQCVAHGVEYVVMEVAAQAVTLHRVAGIDFDGIIFTNFEPEHAEFYASTDEYFAAKCRLFEQARPGAPILVNADDAHGRSILQCVQKQSDKRLHSFGITESDIEISADVRTATTGLLFDLAWQNEKSAVTCPVFTGTFNVYNMLGALGMALLQDIPLCLAARSVGSCCQVPGRMQEHQLSNGARAYIDYAHTPASYRQVLSVLRPRTDTLIVVCGAGGGRDHAKRPKLGQAAAEFADMVIVTSDNPRTEDPAEIAHQMIAGIPKDKQQNVVCELDREKAIQKAYDRSDSNTIIVLLGKGPDEYQLVGAQKQPFSEKAILQQL